MDTLFIIRPLIFNCTVNAALPSQTRGTIYGGVPNSYPQTYNIFVQEHTLKIRNAWSHLPKWGLHTRVRFPFRASYDLVYRSSCLCMKAGNSTFSSRNEGQNSAESTIAVTGISWMVEVSRDYLIKIKYHQVSTTPKHVSKEDCYERPPVLWPYFNG